MHDTPAYNRVAERLNCVLLERTQAFLHSSALLKFIWGEAVKHTVWHPPKQQDPIQDALRQETEFSRIEGIGNEGLGL